MESVSEWNHQEVTGSIPTIGKITKILYNHHHVPQAQISLILSHHSSIAFGRSSRLQPVPVESCCRIVLAGRPTPACPGEGVHRRTSLISSPLLQHQCPECLVRLIWMVLEVGRKLPFSCFGECYFHHRRNFLNIA